MSAPSLHAFKTALDKFREKLSVKFDPEADSSICNSLLVDLFQK